LAVPAWGRLLDAGVPPVGLGARDTLRTEAAMPLYGNDLDEQTTPLEAGLDFAVDLDKNPPFVGQDALRAAPPARRLAGLSLESRRIARPGFEVFLDGAPAGRVTSGTWSPTLGRSIAMAYLPRDRAVPGTAAEIDVRGRREKAAVVPLPFYRRQKT
jgi:aminomethyltransferase